MKRNFFCPPNAHYLFVFEKFKETYTRIIEEIKERRDVLLLHLNQTCLMRDPAELIVRFLVSTVHLSTTRIPETEELFKALDK